MSMIYPFRGLRPQPNYTGEVIAPPYDVVSTAEARLLAQDRPWSFLHISKPEIDLADGTDPYAQQVYDKGRENFDRMRDANILTVDADNSYYLYRIIEGDHCQTGIVVAASIAAYKNNQIRKHELTRPNKEEDRVRQIDALSAQTGPVLLAYQAHPDIDACIAGITRSNPVADVTDNTNIRHQLWAVSDAQLVNQINQLFAEVQTLYIADGHHRSAAAARVAATRNSGNAINSTLSGDSNDCFLAVLFPHNQLRILAYNRVVSDLNGMDVDQFLHRLTAKFKITEAIAPVSPECSGSFGMYVASKWYKLDLREDLGNISDPVARLDVSLLAEHIIAPILGITDPRRDVRIDFMGGSRGLKELAERVDQTGNGVAFALFPTRMEDLMAVADVHGIMPPKSTWFAPKLADGLVSYLLD